MSRSECLEVWPLLLLYPATASLRPPPPNYVAPLLCSSHLSVVPLLSPHGYVVPLLRPPHLSVVPLLSPPRSCTGRIATLPYRYCTPHPYCQMPALTVPLLCTASYSCARRVSTSWDRSCAARTATVLTALLRYVYDLILQYSRAYFSILGHTSILVGMVR